MNSARQPAGIKRRFKSGAFALALVFGTLSLSLWIAALGILGINRGYLGQGYPLHPGLKVSPASLLLDATLQAAPVALIAALVAAALSRLRWFPLLLGALFVIGYGTGIEGIAYLFSIDFGTTWALGEAGRALMTDPFWTPLTLLAGLAALLLFWRVMQPAKV